MITRICPGRVLLAAILIAFGASHQPVSAQILVGTGEDVSFAIVEAEAFGSPLIYEYHYTYDPDEPPDGFDLLTAIDLADPNLTLGLINFGDAANPNYFLDSVTYGSMTLTSDFAPAWASITWEKSFAGRSR